MRKKEQQEWAEYSSATDGVIVSSLLEGKSAMSNTIPTSRSRKMMLLIWYGTVVVSLLMAMVRKKDEIDIFSPKEAFGNASEESLVREKPTMIRKSNISTFDS